MNTELPVSESPSEEVAPTRIVWVRPAVDVLETADGFTLVLDVPGVSKAELQVQVDGRKLTVQGQRGRRGVGWRHAFTVPDTVDSQRVAAALADGVLTLTLPRRSDNVARRIPIS